MSRRFFKGANAGYIGNTEDGKGIRSNFMIRMETEKKSRFFQVREYRVIPNVWTEVKPFIRTVWLEDEGSYSSKLVWKFDGKEISPEDLEIRYEVVEVTNLIDEVSRLYLLDGVVYSPYVNVVKCLEICYIKDEMDRGKKEDKIIIDVIEDYIRKKRESKKNSVKL